MSIQYLPEIASKGGDTSGGYGGATLPTVISFGSSGEVFVPGDIVASNPAFLGFTGTWPTLGVIGPDLQDFKIESFSDGSIKLINHDPVPTENKLPSFLGFIGEWPVIASLCAEFPAVEDRIPEFHADGSVSIINMDSPLVSAYLPSIANESSFLVESMVMNLEAEMPPLLGFIGDYPVLGAISQEFPSSIVLEFLRDGRVTVSNMGPASPGNDLPTIANDNSGLISVDPGFIEATMPMLQGSVGIQIINNLVGTLPVFTEYLTGMPSGGSIGTSLPLFDGILETGATLISSVPALLGHIQGHTIVIGTIAAQFPLSQCSANAGAHLSTSLYRVQGLATGLINVVGSVHTSLRGTTGTITGLVQNSARLTGPLRGLKGQVKAYTAVKANLLAKQALIQGTLTSNTVPGYLCAINPSTQGLIRSSIESTGYLNIVLRPFNGVLLGRVPRSTRILRHIRNEV